MPRYLKEDFDPTKKYDWKMGNVDKLFRDGRCSPLMNQNVGLKEDKNAFVT